MALADGYVSSFETKYLYNYWRPVTAIQTADSDGNPNTSADRTCDLAGMAGAIGELPMEP